MIRGPFGAIATGLTIVDCYEDLGGSSFYFSDEEELVAVLDYTDSPEYCAGQTDTGVGSLSIFYGTVPPQECWFPWSTAAE